MTAVLPPPSLVGTVDGQVAAWNASTQQWELVLPSSYVGPAGPTGPTGPAGPSALPHTITDDKLLSGIENLDWLGWLAATGDPSKASLISGLTSGWASYVRIPVPVTITPSALSILLPTAVTTPTTLSSASVAGTQTAPASGSWTLTTSNVGSAGSIYAAAGICTIGGQVVAYSNWTGTAMTVMAGGYTPSATFTNATAISANLNSAALYDMTSGAFVAGCVDQFGTTDWTHSGQKHGSLIPTPTLAGGFGNFVWCGVQSTGAAAGALRAYTSSDAAANAGPSGLLSGANRRSGTINAATVTGMGSTLAAASLVAANNVGEYWAGLSA